MNLQTEKLTGPLEKPIKYVKTYDRSFYNSAKWRKFRTATLSREEFTWCWAHQRLERLEFPDHLDHIIPISAGGHPLSRHNSMPLTVAAHAIKTNYEKTVDLIEGRDFVVEGSYKLPTDFYVNQVLDHISKLL